MKIYKYKNYEEYIEIQKMANKRKIKNSYVDKNSLLGVIRYLYEDRKISPDISHTASEFENTIEWDFHIAKDEWIGNVDIIYTNSFDHSPKPKECLDIWMSCLKENGVCIIEYSDVCDSKSGRIDCFGATLDEYKEFITKKYDIVDILTNEGIPDAGLSHKGDRWYIIIKNRK